MSKTMIAVATIIVMSVVAYFVTSRFLEWTPKKAALICFGAAGAMILVDIVGAGLKRNRQ